MSKKLLLSIVLSTLCVWSCKKIEDATPASVLPVADTSYQNLHQVCIDKVAPGDPNKRISAASVASYQWTAGQTITLKFLNGDPAIQNKVKSIANQWLNYANLKFVWVGANETANIRIAFNWKGDQGSWSYIGNSVKYVPASEPTVNFGWFTASTPDYDYNATTLHEFGHVLGLIHEHQNPVANIQWNTEAVYKYYTGAPNYWTKADVDNNLFAKYSTTTTNYTAFDAKSIMLYPISPAFTLNNFGTNFNAMLSDVDVYFINQRYPFSTTQRHILFKGQRLLQGQSLTSRNGAYKLTLQGDGNLVLFRGASALWKSNTGGHPEITRCDMQTDGNLVLYDNNNRAYWGCGSWQYPGGFFILQDNGDGVVYQNNVKRWNTNTGS